MKHKEVLVGNQQHPLMEQVYTILDSRIQYIEYQAKNQCRFQQVDPCPSNEVNDKPLASDLLIQNFDKMLSYLQDLNQSLKLLQILKSWLKDDNVQTVFNLLTNRNYLNFTEEGLENYLKESSIG